jgi:phospholipid transport system substrate-binding protein
MRTHLSALMTALLTCLLLTAPAALVASSPESASPAEPGATRVVQESLDAILTVLLDPELRKNDPVGRMKTVQALFRQRFHEQLFCQRALGRQWRNLTQEQQAEFVRLFGDLLVTTYLERIDGYLNSNPGFSLNNIAYLSERSTESYTLVSTEVRLDQTVKIPLMYRMEKTDGEWKVTDIALEGISLLRNYRAQFNEIIANAGYDELLKRLRDKKV